MPWIGQPREWKGWLAADMAKQRIHNEWFQPLVKRTCPCGCKKVDTFAWGEYVYGKWRTIAHFCQTCFVKEVQSRLVDHAGPCGCVFALNARSGYSIPAWIKMPEPAACQVAA